MTNWEYSITVKTIIAICIIIAIFGFILPHWSNNRTKNIKPTTYYLKSLNLDKEIEGNFFLGSGRISGEAYYYYYQINADKSYSLNKIKAISTGRTTVKIIETSIDGPKISITHNKWNSTYIYVFYIPINSIKENYNVSI